MDTLSRAPASEILPLASTNREADQTDGSSIISAVARIVTSYIETNRVKLVGEITDAIREVSATFKAIGSNTEAARADIGVPVSDDFIICLECHRRMKTLARHLAGTHHLTVEAYRAKWHLPANQPMIAPSYAKRRAEIAREASNLPTVK